MEVLREKIEERKIGQGDINSDSCPTKEEIDLACESVVGSALTSEEMEKCTAYFSGGGLGLDRVVRRFHGKTIKPVVLERVSGLTAVEVRSMRFTRSSTDSCLRMTESSPRFALSCVCECIARYVRCLWATQISRRMMSLLVHERSLMSHPPEITCFTELHLKTAWNDAIAELGGHDGMSFDELPKVDSTAMKHYFLCGQGVNNARKFIPVHRDGRKQFKLKSNAAAFTVTETWRRRFPRRAIRKD